MALSALVVENAALAARIAALEAYIAVLEKRHDCLTRLSIDRGLPLEPGCPTLTDLAKAAVALKSV